MHTLALRPQTAHLLTGGGGSQGFRAFTRASSSETSSGNLAHLTRTQQRALVSRIAAFLGRTASPKAQPRTSDFDLDRPVVGIHTSGVDRLVDSWLEPAELIVDGQSWMART